MPSARSSAILPDQGNVRLRVGFQARLPRWSWRSSCFVGLALVYLSFDRATGPLRARRKHVAEPTVDLQVVKLKASGDDVFVNIATPKFAAQAIRKVAEDRLGNPFRSSITSQARY